MGVNHHNSCFSHERCNISTDSDMGQLEIIEKINQPSEIDILCGRGKRYYNWLGNVQFRALVDQSIEKYDQTDSKLKRSIIIVNIVDSVQACGGRFLRQQGKSGQWTDIGRRAACEKVGQTIRDALILKHPERHALKVVTRGLRDARREVRRARENTSATCVPSPLIESATSLNTEKIQSVPIESPVVTFVHDTTEPEPLPFSVPSVVASPTEKHMHLPSNTATNLVISTLTDTDEVSFPSSSRSPELDNTASQKTPLPFDLHPTSSCISQPYTDPAALPGYCLLKILGVPPVVQPPATRHHETLHTYEKATLSDEVLASIPPPLSFGTSMDWFNKSDGAPCLEAYEASVESISDDIFGA